MSSFFIYLLVGVEALVLWVVLVRLWAGLRDPWNRPRKSTGPILLFDPSSGDSEDRKAPPSRP